MKKLTFLLVVVVAVLLWAAMAFIDSSIQEGERKRKIREAPVQMPISWCVNVCQEDIFDDLHSRPTTWGAGSSSLNGMGQDNTFNTVISHCEKTYINGCVKIHPFSGQNYLHNSGMRNAMPASIR